MIFLAAGTQDGRELAGYMLSKGYSVTASAVSSYGGMILKKYPEIVINDEHCLLMPVIRMRQMFLKMQ